MGREPVGVGSVVQGGQTMTTISKEPTWLTAFDLKRAIAERYEAPEWLVEHEVTLGGRRLDVVALNLWASREHRIVGFEIKVDRGDWLREIAAFQKAEQWTEVVDAFYVVTPPKLVRADELPVGWGLLEFTGAKMMTRAHATAKAPSRVLPREVAARFLGRMMERDRLADRTAEFQARTALRAEIQEQMRKELGREAENERERRAHVEKELGDLYTAFGLEFREARRWLEHPIAMRAAGKLAAADFDGASSRLLHTAKTQADVLREKVALLDRLLEEFTPTAPLDRSGT